MTYYARQKTERKQEEYFSNLLREGIKPPTKPSGVLKSTVENALQTIDRNSPDIIDVVMALLDTKFPSLFKYDGPLSDGASTAHLGRYVGIFMRNGNKLDREGRDYWIKPLRDVGIIELVTFDSNTQKFVDGHIKAKSPNSSYRLNKDFVQLLLHYNEDECKKFFAGNAVVERLSLQSKAAEAVVKNFGKGDHHALIRITLEIYASNFLKDYTVVYVDDSDGDRVNDKELQLLKKFGIEITINDAWPDVILVSNCGFKLWFIEAVTSDGEVDLQKVKSLERFAERCGKEVAGYTTSYPDWKTASNRQGKHKNLAPNSYIWIAEDSSKVFKIQVVNND